MSAGGYHDPWTITADDRAKYDMQFHQLKPINGYITGDQAKSLLMRSGLPPAILGIVWELADLDRDGRMDKKEFAIALHLIQKKLLGFEIPKVLPPSMFVESVVPSLPSSMPNNYATLPKGGFGNITQNFNATSGYSTLPGQGRKSGSVSSAGGFDSFGAMSGGFTDNTVTSAAYPATNTSASENTEWAIPQSVRLKYTQTFNAHDRA